MKVYNPSAIGVTTGFGMPIGGTSGQILQKVDSANYNTQWVTPSKRWVTLGRSSSLTSQGATSEVVWNTVTTSTDSGITVSNQNITLPAGTYQVMGTMGTNDYSSPDGYINVALQNSSNVTLPGVNVPNPGPMTAGYNFGVVPTILGVIQLTTQTTVKLRITAAFGTCTINTDTRLSIIEI